MSDRKRQIIEAALKCFSRKGYQATSIQEIVDELGMAKGSIYFYFKSKEDLLLSVIASFGERLMAGMTPQPDERALPPRERFRLQLKRHFEAMAEQRNFPMMLMREPLSIEGSKSQIQAILKDFRRRHLGWLREHIDAIYGAEAAAYAGDGAALFRGMMMEYARAMLVGKAVFDTERLASFLTERLDDIVGGMVRSQAQPILDRTYTDEGRETASALRYEERVRTAAAALRETVEQDAEEADEADKGQRRDFLSALDLFEDEFAKPIPDRILVRGMLAYMRELAAASWQEALERLASLLQFRAE